MKYLMIHKLLWFIIVVAFTLLEATLIFVWAVISLIWHFKIPTALWSQFHSAENDFENMWGGYSYKDKNILETIIRRYKHTW